MGRKTSLTPEVMETILRGLEDGLFLSTACALAGVSDESARNWVERARNNDPDPIFTQFADAMELVVAQHEAKCARRVQNDFKNSKGIAWWLEKRHPDRYGSRVKVEASGPGGGPIQVDVDAASLTERIAALAAGSTPAVGPSDPGEGDRGAQPDGTPGAADGNRSTPGR